MYVPIYRVSADGGAAAPVTRNSDQGGGTAASLARALTSGKVLLYAIGKGADWDEATIVAERLKDNGERKVLIKGGTLPRYLPGGFLGLRRAGALYAVSFDALGH